MSGSWKIWSIASWSWAPKSNIRVQDLPPHVRSEQPIKKNWSVEDLDLKSAIKRLEAEMIEEALKQARGNRSEASRRLNISYPFLAFLKLNHMVWIENFYIKIVNKYKIL